MSNVGITILTGLGVSMKTALLVQSITLIGIVIGTAILLTWILYKLINRKGVDV